MAGKVILDNNQKNVPGYIVNGFCEDLSNRGSEFIVKSCHGHVRFLKISFAPLAEMEITELKAAGFSRYVNFFWGWLLAGF